jgi:hypothetical protein
MLSHTLLKRRALLNFPDEYNSLPVVADQCRVENESSVWSKSRSVLTAHLEANRRLSICKHMAKRKWIHWIMHPQIWSFCYRSTGISPAYLDVVTEYLLQPKMLG